MKKTTFDPEIALEIQFRHMQKSNQLRMICQQQLDAFEPLARQGSHCAVVLDQSQSSQHGTICQVTLRLYIPSQRLYVTHTYGPGNSKELIISALNVAFNDLRRQIIKTRTKRYNRRKIAA